VRIRRGGQKKPSALETQSSSPLKPKGKGNKGSLARRAALKKEKEQQGGKCTHRGGGLSLSIYNSARKGRRGSIELEEGKRNLRDGSILEERRYSLLPSLRGNTL